MTSSNNSFDVFTKGLRKILKANPAVVKAAMEEEKREREEARKAKRASSVPVSASRDA